MGANVPQRDILQGVQFDGVGGGHAYSVLVFSFSEPRLQNDKWYIAVKKNRTEPMDMDGIKCSCPSLRYLEAVIASKLHGSTFKNGLLN
jgi:hypothetical protein